MNRSNSWFQRFEHFMGNADSTAAVSSHLSLLPSPPQYVKFRQFIIFHRGDLATLIRRKLSSWFPDLQLINEAGSVFEFSLKVGRGKEKKISGVFAILPGEQPNFHRVVTVSYTEFWSAAIGKLVHNLYPEAMPVFFKQKETKEALISLRLKLGRNFRLMISDVTMKRDMSKDKSSASSRIETNRRWTELTIEEAYDQASEDGYWFTSIGYAIEKRIRQTTRFGRVATGRIYKTGSINYDYYHDEINDSVARILEQYAAERLEFLAGRGIRERNYQPHAPLQIAYGREIFSDTYEVRRFGEVIARFPNSTRAVFHANPYYHANVADFLDGSSFEIWILSSNKILISPQAKCTEHALERLISHIFYNFNEGELSEYVE